MEGQQGTLRELEVIQPEQGIESWVVSHRAGGKACQGRVAMGYHGHQVVGYHPEVELVVAFQAYQMVAAVVLLGARKEGEDASLGSGLASGLKQPGLLLRRSW